MERILRRYANLKNTITENRAVTYGDISAILLALRRKYFAGNMTLFKNLIFRGLKFEARYCDWLAVREVLIQKEYYFISQVILGKEMPCIIDIGANIGVFSLVAFSYFPSSQIHCYEASPSTAKVLERNAKLNPDLSWAVYNEAAWSGPGEVQIEDAQWSISSLVNENGPEAHAVVAVGLETILERAGGPVDLMKIDIEGSEEKFLSGKGGLLAEVHNTLIELHPGLCDAKMVFHEIKRSYPNLYLLSRAESNKPLILGTRVEYPFARIIEFADTALGR